METRFVILKRSGRTTVETVSHNVFYLPADAAVWHGYDASFRAEHGQSAVRDVSFKSRGFDGFIGKTAATCARHVKIPRKPISRPNQMHREVTRDHRSLVTGW